MIAPKDLLAFFKELLAPFKLWVYGYEMVSTTSTVVFLFNEGKTTLTITRGDDPHKGKEAFPGGFLNPGKENHRKCAKRETEEETHIVLPLERFIFVDERSDPDRDPRGHVIDHGYVVVVGADEKDSVLAMLQHDDDAVGAQLQQVEELLKGGADTLAFDHYELLQNALKVAGFAK